MTPRPRTRLPEQLRPLFWEYPFGRLSWERDRDLVIARVLASGTWNDLLWLHRQVPDAELRAWIMAREGRGLDPRQARYWELILGLPHRQVNAWIARMKQNPWHDRLVKR